MRLPANIDFRLVEARRMAASSSHYVSRRRTMRQPKEGRVPPRIQSQRVQLTQIWEALPEEIRQRTLAKLSWIVTRQFVPTQDGREVRHENHR